MVKSDEVLTYGGFLIDKKMKQKTMNECVKEGLISQKEGFGGRTVVYSTCILDLLEK